MDDTVEHMREHIRLSQSGDRVTLAFTHPDPAVVQRITLDLTTRLVEEFNHEQRNQNAIWIQTWADASEIAANAWSQAAELSRTQSSPRAAYDVELAKQHYAAMKEKLAEAKIEAMLLKRQLGPRVEIRDPGFLPSTHATLWPLPLTGLLLGLFFVSVGASIDFALLMAQPILIMGLALALIAVKAAVLFAVQCAAQSATIPVRDNLTVEGIPPLPLSLVSEVRAYTEARGASLADWHPLRKEMLISTRFGNSNQLHYVKFPGGDRKQLTFFEDAVGMAVIAMVV